MSAKGKRRTRLGAQERRTQTRRPARHRRDAPRPRRADDRTRIFETRKKPVDKQTSNLQNTHLRVVLMRSAHHVGM